MKNRNQDIINKVSGAIQAIRKEGVEIVATEKPAYPGKAEDYYTNGDLAAQTIYEVRISECFPRYGIIGEENNLALPCKIPGKNLRFIVDPLDGTKAYKRGQSHGVGTMIALYDGQTPLAGYVGNVNTGEIIGFGPDDNRVIRHRFTHREYPMDKKVDRLQDGYILLAEDPCKYPKELMELVLPKGHGGLFKGMRLLGGSIGTTFACLWTGDAGAIVSEPAMTPWDFAPIHAVNLALGMVYLRYNQVAKKLERYEPEVFEKVRELPHRFEVVTRPEYVAEVMEKFNS